MSASTCLGTRRSPGDPRIVVLAAIPLILVLLAVGVASAELPTGVMRLTPADAERSGSIVRLIPQSVRGSVLVGVKPASGGMSLLAVAQDGGTVALADQVGELSVRSPWRPPTAPSCGSRSPGCSPRPSPPTGPGWR